MRRCFGILLALVVLASVAAWAEDYTAMVGTWRVTVPVPPQMTPGRPGDGAPAGFNTYHGTVLDPKTKQPALQFAMGINARTGADITDADAVGAVLHQVFAAMGAEGVESKMQIVPDQSTAGFTNYTTSFAVAPRADGRVQIVQANVLLETGKHVMVVVSFNGLTDAAQQQQAGGFMEKLRSEVCRRVAAIPTER
jgi:hypothetical protein